MKHVKSIFAFMALALAWVGVPVLVYAEFGRVGAALSAIAIALAVNCYANRYLEPRTHDLPSSKSC